MWDPVVKMDQGQRGPCVGGGAMASEGLGGAAEGGSQSGHRLCGCRGDKDRVPCSPHTVSDPWLLCHSPQSRDLAVTAPEGGLPKKACAGVCGRRGGG